MGSFQSTQASEDPVVQAQLIVQHCREFVQTRPTDGDLYASWASALVALGQYAEAIEKARLAILYKSTNPDAYGALAYSLCKMGQTKLSDDKFKEEIAHYPTYRAGYYLWGSMLSEAGLWEIAIVVLLTTVAAPLARILCMLSVLLGLRLARPPLAILDPGGAARIPRGDAPPLGWQTHRIQAVRRPPVGVPGDLQGHAGDAHLSGFHRRRR